MKRLLISVFLVLALLLTACAGAGQRTADAPAAPAASDGPRASASAADAPADPVPESTESPPAESAEPAPAEAAAESFAFSGRFANCDGSILALIYNAPFIAGDPIPTVVWNEGEYDQLVIVPRYVGSTVSARAITVDEEGRLIPADKPAYILENTEDGCEISASLFRPEGAPAWLVSVELPDGRSAGLVLTYNGRYGTPAYEFLTDPNASALVTESAAEDWTPAEEAYGLDFLWAFRRAAAREGLDPRAAAEQFFSGLTELGDGAAYTLTESGDMENGVLTLKAARLHTAYDPQQGTLDERTAAQYDLYRQIGNELGILGPTREDDGEDLTCRLTGLTVYNPTLTGRQVRVTVNGTDCGTFDLSESDFVTLIPLELEAVSADRPLEITVEVTAAVNVSPAQVILEVYPGIASNISSAL